MSSSDLGSADEIPQTVKLRSGNRRIEQLYHAGETLVDTSCRAGVPIPTNCRAGLCGTCVVLVLKGKVRMRRNLALDEAQVAAGFALGCQSIPISAECEIRYG
jgi:ferredoxin